MRRNRPYESATGPILPPRFRRSSKEHKEQRTRHGIEDSQGQPRSGAFSFQFSHSRVLFGENVRAETLDPAVEMVSNVSKRPFRLFRDLPKTIPLKEVEFQGVSLCSSESCSRRRSSRFLAVSSSVNKGWRPTPICSSSNS